MKVIGSVTTNVIRLKAWYALWGIWLCCPLVLGASEKVAVVTVTDLDAVQNGKNILGYPNSTMVRVERTLSDIELTVEYYSNLVSSVKGDSARLIDLGRKSDGTYFKEVVVSNYVYSAADNWVNGKHIEGYPFTQEEWKVVRVRVETKLGMPMLPTNFICLAESSLRERLCVPENLKDGCYTCFDEMVGVEPGCVRVVIPEHIRHVCVDAFAGGQTLETIALSSNIVDHISCQPQLLKECCNLRRVETRDPAVARALMDVCPTIEEVVLLDGASHISPKTFYGCSQLCSIVMPDSVTQIEKFAFFGCERLLSVEIPNSVTYIGDEAFSGCTRLQAALFKGDKPTFGNNAFYKTPIRMTLQVADGTLGWNGDWSMDIPVDFDGRRVTRFQSSDTDTKTFDEASSNNVVVLVSTNIVIHYITNSQLSDMVAPISYDTAIVNVFSEIEGGNVAIPQSWAENYPDFESKFGADFTAALTKNTGKHDASGHAMQVWHDFVAGTDPTNIEDLFKASITMVDGKPVISYTPELSEAEMNKRLYTVYGKVKLEDGDWVVIPKGEEPNYNFFKVTVRMR